MHFKFSQYAEFDLKKNSTPPILVGSKNQVTQLIQMWVIVRNGLDYVCAALIGLIS